MPGGVLQVLWRLPCRQAGCCVAVTKDRQTDLGCCNSYATYAASDVVLRYTKDGDTVESRKRWRGAFEVNRYVGRVDDEGGERRRTESLVFWLQVSPRPAR